MSDLATNPATSAPSTPLTQSASGDTSTSINTEAAATTETENNTTEEATVTVFETKPVDVVRQIVEDNRAKIRNYERSVERLRDKEQRTKTLSPIERLKQEREGSARPRPNQPQISQSERDQIAAAANAASARLAAQLTTSLANGLSNALDFYQDFSAKRRAAREK